MEDYFRLLFGDGLTTCGTLLAHTNDGMKKTSPDISALMSLPLTVSSATEQSGRDELRDFQNSALSRDAKQQHFPLCLVLATCGSFHSLAVHPLLIAIFFILLPTWWQIM